jgi:hypothetical protein
MMKSVVLILLGGAILLLSVRRLRQYRLKERYTLLFLFTGLPFFLLALWPDAVAWLAQKMHIEYGTLALIGVTAFLLLMIFQLLTIVSVQDQKIASLAQIVGILMEKHGMSDRQLDEQAEAKAVEPPIEEESPISGNH